MLSCGSSSSSFTGGVNACSLLRFRDDPGVVNGDAGFPSGVGVNNPWKFGGLLRPPPGVPRGLLKFRGAQLFESCPVVQRDVI